MRGCCCPVKKIRTSKSDVSSGVKDVKKRRKKARNLVTSEPGFVKKKSISASLVVGC